MITLGTDFRSVILLLQELMSSQLTPAKKKGKTVLPDRGHRCVHVEDGKLTAVQNPSSPRLMEPITICPRRFVDTHSLQFVEFGQSETIPTYAILSHRWVSAKEVIYDEFIRPSEDTKFKSGYLKIKSACKRAHQDSIRHLCAVSNKETTLISQRISLPCTRTTKMPKCAMHTLWTLEEKKTCLAKSSYSSMAASGFIAVGHCKSSLRLERSSFLTNAGVVSGTGMDCGKIYGIGLRFLRQFSQEQSLSKTDVVTRMSWATDRRTTKRQDEAYCLQGLLGVSVEPDYEEKHRNAFNRLGKVLFEAQPELKEKLGVKDDMRDPDSFNFWYLLWARLYETRKKTDNTREERKFSRQTVEPE
ncbi:hypothetical protein VKT23_017232 [Stygiomarasmius scandens]|uniref:Uncharacterized protein n=1 Tax=Marasmiellus scandens TaxID=2682957 RepID=A0ABR1ISJ5_9AGAR